MQRTIISILGRPLAGKDTQAALLVRTMPDSVIISTGEMIREVKKEGETHRFWPILGPHIEVMDQGILIPEEAINEAFERVVHEKLAEGVRNIIVTAHPRMPKELESYDKMLVREGLTGVFVNLDTSEGYMYAMGGVRNNGRADDRQEVLQTRAKEFALHTEPVLRTLRSEGRLHTVFAERPLEIVQQELQQILRPYLADPEISLPAMARR
jgi:adenylate kinase family enzyme